MKTGDKSSIIAGGHTRAVAAVSPAIEKAVRAEYAAALASAGPLRRIWLQFRLRREIGRRVEKQAPLGGLYVARVW